MEGRKRAFSTLGVVDLVSRTYFPENWWEVHLLDSRGGEVLNGRSVPLEFQSFQLPTLSSIKPREIGISCSNTV